MNNNVGTSDGSVALNTGISSRAHERSTLCEAAFVRCRTRVLSEANFVTAAVEPAH